jgi:tRNA 2-thiouridine synthesizing protein B
VPALHTVNKTPYERGSLESCLRHAVDGSAVLLLEDGVYAAITGTEAGTALAAAQPRLRLFVLGPDLEARGIAPGRLVAGVAVVGYDGFVNLATECDKVVAWL